MPSRASPSPAPQTGRLDWHGFGDGGECGVVVLRFDPQGDVSRHDHLFFELAFVDRGTAVHQTVAGETLVASGDLILIRPQVWHGYARSSADFAVVNCLVHPRLQHELSRSLAQVGASDAAHLLRLRSPGASRTPPLLLRPQRRQTARVRSLLRSLESAKRSRSAGWQAASLGYLATLLSVCVEMIHDGSIVSSGSDSDGVALHLTPRIERVVADAADRLVTHLANPPTLPQLAESLSLSPAYLSRVFTRRLGISPVAYLHRLRAEEACRLLRLTDAPVTEIAQRLGYAEIAYFTRQFRAHVGQPPSVYRKSARLEGSVGTR